MLFSLLYLLVRRLLGAGGRRTEERAWGSETRNRSCGEAVVLVDEPIEQVQPANIEPTAAADEIEARLESRLRT